MFAVNKLKGKQEMGWERAPGHVHVDQFEICSLA